MVASNSKSLKDLSGKWSMNKSLSSDPSPVLELQGVGTLIRKAASHAPISLDVRQKEGSRSSEIYIDQKTAASIPAINEEWILDWQEREQSDVILGKVKSRSRWRKKEELSSEYLKDGFEEDEIVEAEVVSLERDWKAEQAWGFSQIGGSRRFVRKVLTSNNEGKSVETILVYDFEG